MSEKAVAVLYDHPGPKARRINLVVTVVFGSRNDADETAATLTANKDIPYQVIIGTVDAIRKADDGQVLFPDINFGVPK